MTVITVAIMLTAFVFPRTLVDGQEKRARDAPNDRVIILTKQGWTVALPARYADGIADVIMALGVAEAIIFSLGAVCATMIVFYGAVAQRRREVGVLRALGFGRLSILGAFLAESVALSLAGGAVGSALALLTPWLDFNTVNFATGQDVAFHFRPAAGTLVTALGVAAVVGVLGGVLLAIRAARMDAVVAMRARELVGLLTPPMC
jgi:putative ABC transport system permease protein